MFLLGSDSSGLDSCSTDRDSDELSIDLENAFRGDNVGLQSFGVVAAESRNGVEHVACRIPVPYLPPGFAHAAMSIPRNE